MSKIKIVEQNKDILSQPFAVDGRTEHERQADDCVDGTNFAAYETSFLADSGEVDESFRTMYPRELGSLLVADFFADRLAIEDIY